MRDATVWGEISSSALKCGSVIPPIIRNIDYIWRLELKIYNPCLPLFVYKCIDTENSFIGYLPITTIKELVICFNINWDVFFAIAPLEVPLAELITAPKDFLLFLLVKGIQLKVLASFLASPFFLALAAKFCLGGVSFVENL